MPSCPTAAPAMPARATAARPLRAKSRAICTALAALAGSGFTLAGETPGSPEAPSMPKVEVVGTTLLPGSAVLLRRLPANAQIFPSEDFAAQDAHDVAGFLERNAGSVTLNAAQGNPYQADLIFRGFTASPVLGTPQGLSVFLDGVRINESFGDSVNWDLIPPSAISTVQLIPGSNPVFGLNTLGGAVAIYTKRGRLEYPDRPGGSVTASAGSFGRRAMEFETGARSGAWDLFAAGDFVSDEGWARHNSSLVRRAFAKLGWREGATDLELSVGGASNRLEGTQTLPTSFADIREPYTFPDANANRSEFVTLRGSHQLSPALLLSGLIYRRHFENRNFSSNVGIDDASTGATPAVNDSSTIDQRGTGFAVQLAHTGTLAARTNRLTLGLSVDDGRARYASATQPADFAPDRSTTALGPFAPDTDADTRTRYDGAYFSNALELDERWTLTLAGRFNRADVRIADRTGTAPQLNGSHRFRRFNPAVGLSYSPAPALTAYGSYNEGMRAPTAIELTCADPSAPCKLPNNFLADPPLRPVVSKTFEFGARGRPATGTSWSFAIFRTDLHDDLQFLSSGGAAINAGFFQNVGVTRRQGLELGARKRLGPVVLSAHYSLVDATYRTGFAENSPANSTADASGAIVVRRGDRIPGIPRHSMKLRVDVEAGPRWSGGIGALFASGVQARGDENNLDANGRLPGYAVVNLDLRYRIDARLSLFARIDNVFDRRYANFGVLGENFFTGPGQTFDAAGARAEQFRGYAAPRGAWIGVQYRFD